MSPHAKSRAFVVLAAVLWSTSGYFTKVLDLSPVATAAYRALFAALLLTPAIPRARRTFHPLMIAMVLSFAAMNLTFVYSMVTTTAANAIFLEYTAPVWMFLIARVWLKERIERANLIALFGGLLGIGILLAGNWDSDRTGLILGLVTGVTFGAVSLFLRFLKDHDPLWLTYLNLVFSAAVLLPFLPLVAPEALSAPASTLVMAALFGIVQTGLSYVFYARGISGVKAQEAALLTLLEPVINPLWAWLAVSEVPSFWTIVGGAVILSAVAFRYVLPRNFSRKLNW